MRLYLSCNFGALGRIRQICEYLEDHEVEVDWLPNEVPVYCGTNKSTYSTKMKILEGLTNADFYIIMADRYITPHFYQWADLELKFATLLEMPIIVLQPWSCWSVPAQLIQVADYIFDWPSEKLSKFLDSI